MPAFRSSLWQIGQRGLAPAWPVIGMGIFVAAVLTALLGFELWRERGQIETEAFQETANIAALLDAHVAQSMAGAADVLRAFADRAQIALAERTVDSPSFATEFAILPQGLPQIAGLVLLDSTGRVVASSLPSETVGTDVSSASFYGEALAAGLPQGQPHIGNLLRDAPSSGWLIPVSTVVNDRNGARLGVAIVMIDPQAFVGLFNVLNIGRFSAVTLMQSDGVIVARSPDEDRFVGRTIAGGELDRRIASQAPAGSLRLRGVLFGRDLFISYQRIAGTPYVINVAFDAAQVLLPWYRLLGLYAALGVAFFAAIVFSIWLVRQDQARRVKVAAAQQVQELIEGMSTQVALLDAQGSVLEINRAFLALGALSREEIIGRPLWEATWYAHSKESQDNVRAALEKVQRGEIARSDFVVRVGNQVFATADTSFQPVQSAGRTMHVIVCSVDVTERRQLEQQLAQSQKLEAIGMLAGGIAHDFNNLLSAIANFAGFLVDDLKAQPSEQAYASRISRACEHGKQVVKQLLAYARPAAATRSVIDLRAVVSEMEMLVRPSLRSGTELIVEAGPDPVYVRADNAQLVQVFVNVCLNANDALSTGKGTVRLAITTTSPSDALHPAITFRMPAGGDWGVRRSGRPDWSKSYAVVTVSDNGEGMTPQILKRVFDPFYTTKTEGRGTGLGLAIVDSILLSLDGVYQVKTQHGLGTEFSLYLPLERDAPALEAPPARRAPNLPPKIRILFVDDDLNVAESMAMAMTRLQCEALAVDDPVEAFAAISEDPSAWDVIVTDEQMPHMNGTDLIAKVKARNPDLPVILYSGSESVTEEFAMRKGAAAFLRKPATAADLAEAISIIFDRTLKARAS